MSANTLTIDLPDEAATEALAEDLAAILAVGDVVALSGGLGAGKTTFARALIRAVADDALLEVPSPTFTLVQSYATPRLAIFHFDLYRIANEAELAEIGLEEATTEGATLVEWPERAPASLPADRLDIGFEIVGAGRRATLRHAGNWAGRLARTRAVRVFLERAGCRPARRRHLQGDASTRSYERVRKGEGTAVLMDWPPAAVSTVRDRRAAHRARDVRSFVAIDNALRAEGFSAPAVHAADFDQGFLLLEDLGSEGVLTDGVPVEERYRVAVEILAALHARPRPVELPVGDGSIHRLPPFVAEAFQGEIDLFADWYVPHAVGKPLPPEARAEFQAIWGSLIGGLETAEKSWVLLDFHSPNLLWLPERQGLARLGLLDFQDALIGPAAYDVASLAQDARATVPPALETALRDHYVALRRPDPAFDADSFSTAYAILAAERATKILGVFARLADHLGKPRYLQHIPRLRAYLTRSLAHPVLSDLALWYERRLPPA